MAALGRSARQLAVLIAALVLIASGCGDDGEGNEGAAGESTGVLACLRDEGFEANPSAPTDINAEDEIELQLSGDNVGFVTFFADGESANEAAEAQDSFLSGAGGGGAEVIGEFTVLAHARPLDSDEESRLRECIG